MPSQIDVTKPVAGTPTTQSVRDNFEIARNEISLLQNRTADAPFLALSGGRMGGPMYLNNDPTDAMMPATKGYVDANSGGGGPGGGGIPEAPVAGVTFGRQDASWARVVRIAGDTMTGPLILDDDPDDPLGAVTKHYADAIAAIAQDALPRDGGTMTGPLILHDDAATVLEPATLRQSSYNNGRNFFHNAIFNVWQRGLGPFSGPGTITADRWVLVSDGQNSSGSFGHSPPTDADRMAIGDESVFSLMQCGFFGSAATGAFILLCQRVENVWRLAGKTVTVSFWARAIEGTPRIGVGWLQQFGAGGTPPPSPSVGGNFAVTPALSTTWRRYTASGAVPSMAGKTLGVGTEFCEIDFWLSDANAFPERSGGIGVQSGTVQFWGMQLEIGSKATPLEKRDRRADFADCQRFYQTWSLYLAGNGGSPGASVGASWSLPVAMRATPSLVLTDDASGGVFETDKTLVPVSNQYVYANAIATGGFVMFLGGLASADI